MRILGTTRDRDCLFGAAALLAAAGPSGRQSDQPEASGPAVIGLRRTREFTLLDRDGRRRETVSNGCRRAFIALSVVSLLAHGCASTKVTYDKPGITDAQRQRDMNECVRRAVGTSEGWSTFGLYQVDREQYARCLETRGYAPTLTASPQRLEPVQGP